MALELHFHESIVSLDRGVSDDEAASETADESDEDDSGGGGAALGALLALALLAGIAYAVRKRRSADGEAEITIDE